MDSDEEIDIERTETSFDTPKKAKKHKKHKAKKRKSDTPAAGVNEADDDNKPTIKLKLKIGGKTFGTKNVSKKGIPEKGPVPADVSSKLWESVPEPTFKTKKSGADTSDEEQAWLDALEKGDLDDYGAVRKSKDPTLLTARQRSLIHGPKPEELLQLPTMYKNTELTEEQLQRRQQRAKKRREQAQEKREKDKKQTLERLLKKQEAKIKGGKGKMSKRAQAPGFRYTNNADGMFFSVPPNHQFPFAGRVAAEKPKLALKCAIEDCKNIKKYSCSKTGVPLCSLECYRKNMNSRAVVAN